MMIQQRISLRLGSSGQPPTEFRLFKSGLNETSKGTYLFDAQAAESVMTTFGARCVDLAIDLEHQMLDAATSDPTARDARGWFKLALRKGELWAVNVRWTADGAARLMEKRQRYVSPAFKVDDEGRVLSILNVAIVAMPATHATEALIAASQRNAPGDTQMEPTPPTPPTPTLEDLIAALEANDPATALEIAQRLLAAEDDALPAESAPSKPAESAPAALSILRLTGCTTLAQAAREVEVLTRDLSVAHEALASSEALERRMLLGKLVTAAGQTPGQVWGNLEATIGKPYLARMSIVELRAHVTESINVVPPHLKKQLDVSPPNTHNLTARQRQKCEKLGVDPSKFASTLARMSQVSKVST